MPYLGVSPVDGISLPVQVSKGGTGGTTQATARSGIGISAAVDGVVTAVTTSAAQDALGAGAAGKTVFASSTQATARTNLGLGTAALLDVGTDANQVVQLNGSGALPAVSGANLTGIAGGFSNINVITSTGNWTVPAGVTKVKVTVVGGGGGGGAGVNACGSNYYGGSGGGGGGAALKIVSGLTPGSTVVCTVGAVSTGAGNTSSFGAYCSATGGSVGTSTSDSGLGGIGSSGDLNLRGGAGGARGILSGSLNGYCSGAGGDSIFGGGGNARGGVGAGIAGVNGGGGSGGVQGGNVGGNGGGGVIVIEY